MDVLTGLAWIPFSLSVVLIPLNLLPHWQVPPFTRYESVQGELGWALALGIVFRIVRLLLHILPSC